MAHYRNTSKSLNTNPKYNTIVTKHEDKFRDPLDITGYPFSTAAPIRPVMEMATQNDSVSLDDRSLSSIAFTNFWQVIDTSDILGSDLPKITLLGPAPIALEFGANYIDTRVQNSIPTDFKSILASTIFFLRLRISYDNKISFNW